MMVQRLQIGLFPFSLIKIKL